MPLPLERTLKREVLIDGEPYTVTLSPLGVKLVRKGFRKGHALSWRTLLAVRGPGADGLDDVDEPEDAALPGEG